MLKLGSLLERIPLLKTAKKHCKHSWLDFNSSKETTEDSHGRMEVRHSYNEHIICVNDRVNETSLKMARRYYLESVNQEYNILAETF